VRLRFLVPTVAALGVATGTAASSAPPVSTSDPALGSSTLERRVGEAEKRIQDLIDLAQRSLSDLQVRAYGRYALDALAREKKQREERGEVTTERLFEIVADSKEGEAVRERAVAALVREEALSTDPELALGGRGLGRPRARVSNRHFTKMLTDKDDFVGRRLADDLLKGWWPEHVREQDIFMYDAGSGNERQWREARQRWERLLRTGR
jgi:hypothetical protein